MPRTRLAVPPGPWLDLGPGRMRVTIGEGPTDLGTLFINTAQSEGTAKIYFTTDRGKTIFSTNPAENVFVRTDQAGWEVIRDT